jgi:hypothetical protein
VRHEGGEGAKLFEENVEGGEDVVLGCRGELARKAVGEGEDEGTCTVEKSMVFAWWGVGGGLWMKG